MRVGLDGANAGLEERSELGEESDTFEGEFDTGGATFDCGDDWVVF